MDHFISQYFGMNIAHLSDDELAHELVVRGIDIHGESRSVLERKCRAALKKGSAEETPEKEYERVWESLIDEIETCDKNVQVIKQDLKSRAYRKAPEQKFKSRLLHYLFRMLRSKAHTTVTSELNSIGEIAGQCVRLLNTFYCLASPYPEVRNAEMSIANDSLLRLRYAFPEANVDPNDHIQNPNHGDQQRAHDGIPDEANLNLRGSLHPVPEEIGVKREEELELEEEEAAGGESTEDIELLKVQNAELRTLLDQLLKKMSSMEVQIGSLKSCHHSKNSTRMSVHEENDEEESGPTVK